MIPGSNTKTEETPKETSNDMAISGLIDDTHAAFAGVIQRQSELPSNPINNMAR